MTTPLSRRASRDSQRTAAVFNFIATYQASHGYGPSLREIAAGVGLNTAQSAVYHVEVLASRRRITRTPGVARSIRTVEVPTC